MLTLAQRTSPPGRGVGLKTAQAPSFTVYGVSERGLIFTVSSKLVTEKHILGSGSETACGGAPKIRHSPSSSKDRKAFYVAVTSNEEEHKNSPFPTVGLYHILLKCVNSVQLKKLAMLA